MEELEQLCMSLVEDMGQVREQLGVDIDLSTPGVGDFDYYAQQSVLAMQMLAEQYPILDRSLYSAPKPVVMSELMSQVGISGIFVHFTMEFNINVNVPFFALPSTMTHELAHQCGFMREDEASFIAYLACKQHEQFWSRHEGIITNISATVIDIHLKVNNQADGVDSYGRMVDLLLAEQTAASGQPDDAQGVIR